MSIQILDISAVTTFTSCDGPILLPSFNQMNGLSPLFTFQGWYIRTNSAGQMQRIDNPEAPNAMVTIPWQGGVFAPDFNVTIWIEARWG
jgi:hypothetical protein